MSKDVDRRMLSWGSAGLALVVAVVVVLVAAMGITAGGADHIEADNLRLNVPAGWDARAFPGDGGDGATLQVSSVPITGERDRTGISAAEQLPPGEIYINVSQDDGIPLPGSYPRVESPQFAASEFAPFEGIENPNVAVKTVRTGEHVVHVLVALGDRDQTGMLVVRANNLLSTLEV